jgi:preprotein translocase subunit SecE
MFGKFGKFFSETYVELKKVTMPTWSELRQATLVVITVTFIMAFFVGVVDFFLSSIMRILFG